MSATFYKNLSKLVLALLTKYGLPSNVLTTGGATIKGQAVFDDSHKSTQQSTTTQADTRLVYFIPSNLKSPKAAPPDIIVINKVEYAIVDAIDITPGGLITVLYQLRVAK